MSGIQLRAAGLTSVRLQGRIKLARLLKLPESEFALRIREIEADPLFHRLSAAGVLSIQSLPRVRYATRALEGRHLRASDDNLAELCDGTSDVARLIKRVGQENFEEWFLKDERSSDAERARVCGISQTEARELREFMDRLYVRAEFEATEDRAAPVTMYSSVAGIEIEDGRPVLGFFNREIWKGRYDLDESRYLDLKATLTTQEAAQVEQFLRQIDLLAFRRTTLYRVLEILVATQTKYLLSGEPDQRSPLTQREVSTRLGVAPSVLSQLIGNKSVEMPWRLETPLKTLLPSRKTMMRDRLYDLAMEHPEVGDDVLREEIQRLYGATLSRPSIIQYRKELGLGGCGHRGGQEVSR